MEGIDLEKIKDGLKKSPVFKFSLGSKELFHSNFLEWVALKYPEITGELFSKFLKNREGDITIKKVEREKENKDLWLFFSNGQELVIENKVKSLPDRDQLEAYSRESSTNQNFLLLTLVEPDFEMTAGWNILTYAELSVLMDDFYAGLSDSYYKQILNDYIFVIKSLGKMFENIGVKASNKFSFYSSKDDLFYATLGDLRMGDVYQKLKYQSLSRCVYNDLLKIFQNESIYYNDGINRFKKKSLVKIKDKERQEGAFYFGSGMTRSQGMMEVAYVLTKGLFLTIQIQGNQYKKMIQGYSGYKDSKKVAEMFREKKLWFDFSHVVGHLKEYPQRDKIFNKYGDKDFYRSVALKPEIEIEDIMKFIRTDIQNIKDRLSQMKSILLDLND